MKRSTATIAFSRSIHAELLMAEIFKYLQLKFSNGMLKLSVCVCRQRERERENEEM